MKTIFFALVLFALVVPAADATVICTADGRRFDTRRKLKNPIQCDHMDWSFAVTIPACFKGLGGVSWRRARKTTDQSKIDIDVVSGQLAINKKIIKTRGRYSAEQMNDLIRVALDISENVGPSGRLLFSLISSPHIKKNPACRSYAGKILFSSASTTLNHAPQWIMLAIARADLAGAAALGQDLRKQQAALQAKLSALKAKILECDDNAFCYQSDEDENDRIIRSFGQCVEKKGLSHCKLNLALAVLKSMARVRGWTTHVTSTPALGVTENGQLLGNRIRFRLIRKGRGLRPNRLIKVAKFAAKAAAFAANFDGTVLSDLIDLADLVADLSKAARKALRNAPSKGKKPRAKARCDFYLFPKEGHTPKEQADLMGEKAEFFVEHCVEERG